MGATQEFRTSPLATLGARIRDALLVGLVCGVVSAGGLFLLSLLAFGDGGAFAVALFIGGIVATQSALIWFALLSSPLRASRFWQAVVLVGGGLLLDYLILAVALFVPNPGVGAEAAAVTAVFGGLAYLAPLVLPLAAGAAASMWLVGPNGPLNQCTRIRSETGASHPPV